MRLRELKSSMRPAARRARALVHSALPSTCHLLPDDVFVASFPKSGNTLFRFIWSNMELGLAGDNRVLHFGELETTFNTEYESGRSGSFTFEHLPRLVKTHNDRRHVPLGRCKAVWIVRNPGDALVSYHKYMQNHEYDRFQTMPIRAFLSDRKYGIAAWIRHTLSWRNSQAVPVSYDDLYLQPSDTMRRVFSELEIPIPRDEILELAVEKSSFSSVRRLEEQFGHSEGFARNFKSQAKFARSGESGQWKSEFDADDIAYVNAELERAGLSRYRLVT